MKNFFAGLIIFAGSSLLTYNSCENNTTKGEVPDTALTALNLDPSLSIFSTIANFSGNEDYVNNSSAIIIPVDSAFINAGITKSVATHLSPPEGNSIVMYYTFLNGIDFHDTPGKEIGFSSGLGPVLPGRVMIDIISNPIFLQQAQDIYVPVFQFPVS